MCGKQRVKNAGFGSVAMIGLRTRFFGCVARTGDREQISAIKKRKSTDPEGLAKRQPRSVLVDRGAATRPQLSPGPHSARKTIRSWPTHFYSPRLNMESHSCRTANWLSPTLLKATPIPMIRRGPCRRRRKKPWRGLRREFGRAGVCRPQERCRERCRAGRARRRRLRR
jgi:hypothetical protein